MLKYHNFDIVFQEIPDEITLAINLTGCKNKCINCHSKHLQKDEGEILTHKIIEQLFRKYSQLITCICFMGGDHDIKSVEESANFIKMISNNNLKTAWYSGKDYFPNDLRLDQFDYIKIGSYIESLGGLRSPETNQRLFINVNGKLKDVTVQFWTR